MKKVGNTLFVILAVLSAFPVVATFIFSFRTPSGFSLGGYFDLFFDCFIFYPMFWHSIFYGVAITLLQLLIIIPCAFGFSNAKFKGKGLLFIFYIILMMMPLQVTILPNYIGLRDIGLIDKRLGIILPMAFSPFGVVVMHQYMKSINNSLIEATRLETNSMIKVILTSVIPQIKTCAFAVVLYVFAESFNMLEQPMLFLKTREIQPLSVFIANYDNYVGDILFPASVIFIIPIIILHTFFKKSLEKGLKLGDLL